MQSIILLISVGVFRRFGATQKELLWQAHALANNYVQHQAVVDLFELTEVSWSLPPLWQHELEDLYEEIELLAFPLQSPFRLLAVNYSDTSVNQLSNYVGKWVSMVGYLIIYKRTIAKNGRLMVFGYFMDAEGEYFDTTHFPHIQQLYPLRRYGLYKLEGKVVLEFGFPSLEVCRLEECALLVDPRDE